MMNLDDDTEDLRSRMESIAFGDQNFALDHLIQYQE